MFQAASAAFGISCFGLIRPVDGLDHQKDEHQNQREPDQRDQESASASP